MMKSCKNCNQAFEITNQDLAFYEKVSPIFNGKKELIPPPTHCFDCRLQRKTAWRNERSLYQRKCGKCQKDIISVFSPESKVPIYCNICWWGKEWDPESYGRDVDLSRSFFEQLSELLQTVPQLAIQNDNDVTSVNCQYCQDFAYGKNCYFVTGSWYTEDSFYSSINSSYNRVIGDCINVQKCELVYECIDSQGLYNCAFLRNSENCADTFLGIDLKGCSNCFGCVGLRHKKFYIFNEPYSEEEYKKKIAEFAISSASSLEELKKKFTEFSLKFPRKNMNLQNCENSEGNDLFNCKDSMGFSLVGAEGARYCAQGDLNTFSYDIFNSGRPNWCYEGMTPDDSYLTHFSWFSWKNKNVLYGFNCHSSEHLFGCASMHRAKYCILNKQYTKEEYEALVPKIIESMIERGEWGEFLSAEHSFFGYNETVAHEYFPLSKEQAIGKGLKWEDPNPKNYLPQTYEIPDSIFNVSDVISQQILACAECKKNYKIIPQELKFYQKMRLPIPRKCPDCRHRVRIELRNPYNLWNRQCAKCSNTVKTSFAPDRPEIVYCEKCYLAAVY